jgi:hypothetical protein
VYKNAQKRRLGVVENLYNGTSQRFAHSVPSVLQNSPEVIHMLAIKHINNPLDKGPETHPTAFST